MLIPIGYIILLELLLRPFFHGAQTLVADFANDTVYFSMLIFGYIYAAEKSVQIKIKNYYNLSKFIIAVSLIILFFVNYKWQCQASNDYYLIVFWVCTKGIYECSAIIFLICLGSKYFNRPSRQITYLSGSSFIIYIFHFIPVSFFSLLFLRLNMNVYLKYLLCVVFSYVAVLIINEIWRRLKTLLKRIR